MSITEVKEMFPCWYNPSSINFENGSGGSGGGAGSGGSGSSGDGSGDDKGKTGNGDDKGKQKTGGDDPMKATHTITVDGETHTITVEEALKAAEKVGGADKKFEDAAKERKEAQKELEAAQKGVRIAKALEKVQVESPAEDDVKEFMEALGVTPDMVEGYDKLVATGRKGQEPPKKLTLTDFDESTQKILKAAEDDHLASIRQTIEDEVKSTIAKDTVLTKTLGKVDDDTVRKAAADEIAEMAVESVRGRILAGEPWGPEMLQSTAQRLRSRIERLGIPAKSSGKAPVLGLGPIGTELAGPEVTSDEPIKRVPSSDPNWVENVVKRVQQAAVRAFRSGE
jgi:hypothetical protein